MRVQNLAAFKKLKGVTVVSVSVVAQSISLLGSDGYIYTVEVDDYWMPGDENPAPPTMKATRYKEKKIPLPKPARPRVGLTNPGHLLQSERDLKNRGKLPPPLKRKD